MFVENAKTLFFCCFFLQSGSKKGGCGLSAQLLPVCSPVWALRCQRPDHRDAVGFHRGNVLASFKVPFQLDPQLYFDYIYAVFSQNKNKNKNFCFLGHIFCRSAVVRNWPLSCGRDRWINGYTYNTGVILFYFSILEWKMKPTDKNVHNFLVTKPVSLLESSN